MRLSFEKENARNILYLSVVDIANDGNLRTNTGWRLRWWSWWLLTAATGLYARVYNCEFGIRRLHNYACIGNTNPSQQYNIISFCNLFRRYRSRGGAISVESPLRTRSSCRRKRPCQTLFFLQTFPLEHTHILLMLDLYVYVTYSSNSDIARGWAEKAAASPRNFKTIRKFCKTIIIFIVLQ